MQPQVAGESGEARTFRFGRRQRRGAGARSGGVEQRQQSDLVTLAGDLARHLEGYDPPHGPPAQEIRPLRLHGSDRLEVVCRHGLDVSVEALSSIMSPGLDSVERSAILQVAAKLRVTQDVAAAGMDAEKRQTAVGASRGPKPDQR